MKSKKSALLLSFTSLLICFAMLVGSTFAWFTDTATTGVNKIVSGNLKVDIIGETGEDHLDALKFTKADATTDTGAEAQILWEPGCRYLTQGFRIANKGNLALKWKAQVNKGTTATNDGGYDLLDVIDFYLVKNDINDEGTPLDEFTGNLTAGAKTSDVYYIKGVMDKDAGNNYQNLTLDGITITVYATQDTVEYDSFDDQYDKDATYLTYPAGVTTESFPESVDYSTWTGSSATAPATAAYVDNNGAVKYVADLTDAIEAGATTVYLKADATVNLNMSSQTNRTPALTKDLTVYANGADMQYGEIAMSYNADANNPNNSRNENVTLKVYDAKNIRIFGQSPADGVTQNVILENCTYEGAGINKIPADGIFYLSDKTGTINLTMNNCKVSGSNQGVYKACDGDVIVTNSSFEGCAAGMKISHKGAGTCNVTVKDTTFNSCGWDTDVTGKEWLKNDSSAIKCKTEKGTMTLILENVTITNMVGSNSIVAATGVTVQATNVTVDGQAWPATSGGNEDPDQGDEP